MFSLDLKDTYFQIPIHLDSQPSLRIALNGKVFQFKALCFGLFTTPQSVCFGLGVGSQERDLSTLLPGQLVDHSGVSSSPAGMPAVPLLSL